MERQNKFLLRKGDSTPFVRMDAVNEETSNNYFSLFEGTLKKHPELLIHSESTCIADEFSYIK